VKIVNINYGCELHAAKIGTFHFRRSPSVSVQMTNYYYGTNDCVAFSPDGSKSRQIPDGYAGEIQHPDSSGNDELGELLNMLTAVLGNSSGNEELGKLFNELNAAIEGGPRPIYCNLLAVLTKTLDNFAGRAASRELHEVGGKVKRIRN